MPFAADVRGVRGAVVAVALAVGGVFGEGAFDAAYVEYVRVVPFVVGAQVVDGVSVAVAVGLHNGYGVVLV